MIVLISFTAKKNAENTNLKAMNKDQIIKALLDRLNAMHSTVDKVTDGMVDMGATPGNSDHLNDLVRELNLNVKILKIIEHQIYFLNEYIEEEICGGIDENERLKKENEYLTQSIRDIRSQLIDRGCKEDSIQILGIDLVIKDKKEIRVYLVDANSHDELLTMPNEKFIGLAEEEGKVYTLPRFVDAFNQEEINTFIDFIRII